MTKSLIPTTKKEIQDLDTDLTPKQRAFLKRYFECGNGTLSALEVYDCKDEASAAEIASQNLRKLKNPIRAFMEAKGISLGRLVETLSDGLKANRVISAVNTNNEATGADTNFIEVPDHLTRHRYMETAAKWLGIVEEKAEVFETKILLIPSELIGKYNKETPADQQDTEKISDQ